MTDAPVYLRPQGEIAELILNRPDKKNALTQAMWEAIPSLVAQAAADADVKVLVLRSSTPGVFSAGADIAEFEAIAKDPARREANRLAVREAQRSLALLEKPTIAMIDGACVGGGCGLALACDLRLASPPSRLGITPVKLGLIYSVQDTKQLMDLVGPAHAKSILFTGRLVSAEEALGMGLVNAVHPAETLEQETRSLAETIAANSQWGVRGIKRIMRMILTGVTDDTPETEEMFRQSFGGVDYLEGVDAFLNRRKANFPYR
jgi:enoyl-CoA hydratase/carnithine racemase